MNWIAIIIATLVPVIVGSIWYNPKVLGKAWLKSSGLNEEEAKGGNMVKIFGFTLLFSFFLAVIFQTVVIHQTHIGSILMEEEGFDDPESEVGQLYAHFTEGRYSENFRTFKHGAFHGLLVSILFVLPIIGIIGLFERKSFKYIFIHTGYWTLSLVIMGAIICGWQ